MKKILVFLAIAGTILACGKGGNDTQANAAKPEARTVADIDGEKIYKNYCVTCHGLYGDMGAGGAYNLTESELTVEERTEVITNGRNAMTGFKALLSEEKIKAVAEYTLELKKEEE